jgi:hypothetical protein
MTKNTQKLDDYDEQIKKRLESAKSLDYQEQIAEFEGIYDELQQMIN